MPASSCQFERGLLMVEKKCKEVREICTQQLFTSAWIIYHFQSLCPEQIPSDKMLPNTDKHEINWLPPFTSGQFRVSALTVLSCISLVFKLRLTSDPPHVAAQLSQNRK